MKTILEIKLLAIATALILLSSRVEAAPKVPSGPYNEALMNGLLANEGFRRSEHYVQGWLELADPKTGLIPRNKRDRYWNARDAAADNYPFMVLTSSFTNRERFSGLMEEMLETEIKLTSRLGALPDSYDFAMQGFLNEKPNLDDILFGASEYIKDGLLPLTEWLGQSPWSNRMFSILDEMWERAPVETPFGRIVSTDVEVNGEMLQVLSRLYWKTGEAKYLEWAIRLGDYYLLGDHHPTRDMERLRLRDHGCEIVSGLCELYVTVNFAHPEKRKVYQAPVHEMLDRILEIGVNEHGFFYDAVNPISGEPVLKRIADNFGYTYNGFYSVYLVDNVEAYRTAARETIANLYQHYKSYRWEGASSDGYADAIEGALNLYNREPIPSVADWIDSEIHVMWNKQRKNGVIEGWHGDGNFARTTVMYCLWKSQGTSAHPWREDLVLGAVEHKGSLRLCLTAEADWEGKIHFDSARHKTNFNLPLDWPRINQFPEWFTADADQVYAWKNATTGETKSISGQVLLSGVDVKLKAGERLNISIEMP